MHSKIINIDTVINSARYFGLPFVITLMMTSIMLADGYDLFLMGHVSTFLIHDWKITRAELGPINTAGLIGMATGSVALGWLGDRIGRTRAYFSCLLFLFIGSLVCYNAAQTGSASTAQASIEQMVLGRFIMGLGMGGVTPLAATIMSEWIAQPIRSLCIACVISAVPLGGFLTGFVSRWVEWPQMFLIGSAVPLGLFIAFIFFLPESPRYLLQNPKHTHKLANTLNRLIGKKRFDGSEHFVLTEENKYSTNWLATIWNAHYRLTTLCIWLVFSFNSFVLYVYTNYLKVLLPQEKISTDTAGLALMLFSIGAFLGSIASALIVPQLGSRPVGTSLAFLGVLASASLGAVLYTPNNPAEYSILVLSFALGIAINGMQVFIYTVSTYAYPTHLRGSAVGLAQTVSRLGAVLSPIAVTTYLQLQPQLSISGFFVFIASCALVTTLCYFLIPAQIPPLTKVTLPQPKHSAS
ncbi:MAG: hypothetical protein RL497_2360 [Pseudomonadota bacterium]|jgi:AAHS family 4-hydroxybenzoate transporter-like MFS transporter